MFVHDIHATSIIFVYPMDLFVSYASGYKEQVSRIPILRSRVFWRKVDVVDLSGRRFDIVVCVVSFTFPVWSVDHKHSVPLFLFL